MGGEITKRPKSRVRVSILRTGTEYEVMTGNTAKALETA
jgi:hypothetical protein